MCMSHSKKKGREEKPRLKVRTIFYFLAIVETISLIFTSAGSAHGKQVVGWVEKVRIYPGNIIIRAKLDTGARNSSLHASHITEFTRNGEEWVRFEVTGRNGKAVPVESKVHRVAKIKRQDAKPERRLAIVVGICLGDFYKEVEVNLVDRSDFIYQMLIGRSFMRGNLIVEPSVTYTTNPICKGAPGQ
jgi:hypothetical protein